MIERKVLGKGLEALISREQLKEDEKIELLNPDQISRNRYQPRVEFEEDKLQELMVSVKEKGLVQPIIVRRNGAGEYELIAGERRLRAVKALGLKEIPAVVKNVSDLELLELSLIENIQRENLNPLEEAKAYDALMNDFNFTQEQIAKTVGKDRTTVSNMTRLLSLPEPVKDALAKQIISLGHAKVILSLQETIKQLGLLDKIIKENLSVREAENHVAGIAKHKTTKRRIAKDNHILELESELQHILGTKVKVIHGRKRGKIQIEYYSLDDLDRILNIIRKKEKP